MGKVGWGVEQECDKTVFEGCSGVRLGRSLYGSEGEPLKQSRVATTHAV